MKNKILIELLPIETERLIIDKTTTNDINLILKMDKQEITQKFLGGIKNKTKDERIEFLKKKEEKFKQGIASSLTVNLKVDNSKIAFVGLKIDEEENLAEISYIFDEDYTKKGYCKEAILKLLDIAFNELKLDKVIADTVEDNLSSRNVLERLNFRVVSIKIDNNIKFINYELKNKEFTV